MALLKTSQATKAYVDLLVAVAKHCAAIHTMDINYFPDIIYVCSCCKGGGRTKEGWRDFTFTADEIFTAKQKLQADPEADQRSLYYVHQSMTLCPQCVHNYARPLLAHIEASDRNEP